MPAPARGVLVQASGMALLVVTTTIDFWRSPGTYWRETIDAAWTVVRRTTIPLALSVFVLGFGALGISAGNVLEVLGSTDRTGSIYATAAVREIATWVTAMVVAGVAGAAVCADFGARKVRDEIEALAVLGIKPTRLVAPQAIALSIVAPLLLFVAIAACLLSGVVATLILFDTTVSGFVASLKANFFPPELYAALVKTSIFGLIIATVCSYKGINAAGGSEGVGRAVNQAVVISFAALWVANYAIVSLTLALFPELQGLR